MPAAPRYDVLAVKYAERDGRRPEHFLGGDRHDVSMPMDYFVWVIRQRSDAAGRDERDASIVVDTGFGVTTQLAACSVRRGHLWDDFGPPKG